MRRRRRFDHEGDLLGVCRRSRARRGSAAGSPATGCRSIRPIRTSAPAEGSAARWRCDRPARGRARAAGVGEAAVGLMARDAGDIAVRRESRLEEQTAAEGNRVGHAGDAVGRIARRRRRPGPVLTIRAISVRVESRRSAAPVAAFAPAPTQSAAQDKENAEMRTGSPPHGMPGIDAEHHTAARVGGGCQRPPARPPSPPPALPGSPM